MTSLEYNELRIDNCKILHVIAVMVFKQFYIFSTICWPGTELQEMLSVPDLNTGEN